MNDSDLAHPFYHLLIALVVAPYGAQGSPLLQSPRYREKISMPNFISLFLPADYLFLVEIRSGVTDTRIRGCCFQRST